MCRQRRLASGSIARVDYCDDCDVVSITLGAVTVRVDPAALGSMSETLRCADAELRRDARPPAWGDARTRGIA